MRTTLLLSLVLFSCSTFRSTPLQCDELTRFLTTLQKLGPVSDWAKLTRNNVEAAWYKAVARRTTDVSVFADGVGSDGCGCWQAALYADDHLRQIRVIRREPTRAKALAEAHDVLLAVTPSDAANSSVAGPDHFRMYRWTLAPAEGKMRQIGFDFEIAPCRNGSTLSMTVTLFP